MKKVIAFKLIGTFFTIMFLNSLIFAGFKTHPALGWLATSIVCFVMAKVAFSITEDGMD